MSKKIFFIRLFAQKQSANQEGEPTQASGVDENKDPKQWEIGFGGVFRGR